MSFLPHVHHLSLSSFYPYIDIFFLVTSSFLLCVCLCFLPFRAQPCLVTYLPLLFFSPVYFCFSLAFLSLSIPIPSLQNKAIPSGSLTCFYFFTSVIWGKRIRVIGYMMIKSCVVQVTILDRVTRYFSGTLFLYPLYISFLSFLYPFLLSPPTRQTRFCPAQSRVDILAWETLPISHACHCLSTCHLCKMCNFP